MNKKLLLLGAAFLAASTSFADDKSITYNGNYEYEHFIYEVGSHGYNVYDTEQTSPNYFTDIVVARHDGNYACLKGVTDDFYLPSKLVIPDEIVVEGQKVPVIAVERYSKFTNTDKIKSVVASKNLIAIDGFDNCKNLTEVTLNNGIKAVGGFENCTALTKINIPESVTSITERAFRNSGLTEIALPSSVCRISYDAFMESANLKTVRFSENTISDAYTGLNICDNAFYGCSALDKMILPSQTVHIGNACFNDCYAMTSIEVNNNCEAYKSVNGVLLEKDGSHYNALYYPDGKTDTHYTFPAEISGGHIKKGFIGTNENNKLKTLDNLDFTELTEPIIIDSYAIEGISARDISLDNVKTVHPHGLEFTINSLRIGAATDSIHPEAFHYFNGKFTVDADNKKYCSDSEGSLFYKLDDGLKLVQTYRPSKITSYKLADNVLEIGEAAFAWASELKELTLTKNLRSIGNDAFIWTNKLEKITIPYDNNLEYVACDALSPSRNGGFGVSNWYNIQPDGPIYIGNVLCAWKGAIEQDKNITNLKRDTKMIAGRSFCNKYYNRYDSRWYEKSDKKLMSRVSIPQSVERIGECAFCADQNLISATLPSTIKIIDQYAFYSTPLTSIVVPDGCSKIDYLAFGYCSAEEITIGSYGADPICKIGEYAFAGNVTLKKLLLGESVISIGKHAFYRIAEESEKPVSVEIPSSVISIGDYAFQDANIDKLRIGASVETIGLNAFTCKQGYDDYDYENDKPIGLHLSLKEVHSDNPVPPVFLTNEPADETESEPRFFTDEVYEHVPLFVPEGTVEAYRSAPGWKQFAWIFKEGDYASINNISDESDVEIKAMPGQIAVTAPVDAQVVVTSISGTTLYNGNGSITLDVEKGVYIVTAGNKNVKLFVR